MARVYLETSFVSACVSSRTDTRSAYRREASLEWWQAQRHLHELFASAEVDGELRRPGFKNADDALSWISGIPWLQLDDRVIGLATVLVGEKVMPAPVAGDSVHVAAACIHGIDYMLSWNVRHLANPNKIAHLNAICLRFGMVPPRIVTPESLWEQDHE